MIALHTQKTLDKLTWHEVRAIHSSLGLKATASTRSRRDYQTRIVAAQPQPVAEPEAIATPLTCATCSLARQIEDNRYCCGWNDAVVRGHWEATYDCYDAVVAAAEVVVEAETLIAKETITQTQSESQAPIQPIKTRLSNHPFRYKRDIFQGQHSFSSSMYGLCECAKCVERKPSQFSEPKTEPNCYDAVVAANQPDDKAGETTKTEASIAPQPKTVAIAQVPHAHKEESIIVAMTKESAFQKKMSDLGYLAQLEMEAQLAVERAVIGSKEEVEAYRRLRKIERDIELYDCLTPEADEIKPEGTIHWHSPSTGIITGKKGAIRNFYIKSNGEIMIVISANFTASENKNPNTRHKQIRVAIESGRAFNPRAFMSSPNFEHETEVCDGGRICQECDGRWWGWVDGGITGHPFPSKNQALHYFAHAAVNNTQNKRAA